MKAIALIIPLLYSIGCTAQLNDTIITVAHRGASKYAPENTIAAIERAWKMGIDMVEMDVRQTKDGHFILMHDHRLNRTTNGRGRVEKKTLEEIKKLDTGSWFGEEFKGEKVPTLREALRFMKNKIMPDIDFKAGNPEELIQVLKEEGFLDGSQHITFHTGNLDHINAILQLTDKVHVRPSYKYGFGKYKEDKLVKQPQIVNIGWSAFSPEYVEELHQAGIKAFVNCLNSADKKENIKAAIAAGADYVQADNIEDLVELIENVGK